MLYGLFRIKNYADPPFKNIGNLNRYFTAGTTFSTEEKFCGLLRIDRETLRMMKDGELVFSFMNVCFYLTIKPASTEKASRGIKSLQQLCSDAVIINDIDVYEHLRPVVNEFGLCLKCHLVEITHRLHAIDSIVMRGKGCLACTVIKCDTDEIYICGDRAIDYRKTNVE